MQNVRSIVDEPADRPAGPARGLVRQTVELLVCLASA